MKIESLVISLIVVLGMLMPVYADNATGTLIGRVVDDVTGQVLPARIYITASDGKTYLPDDKDKMVGIYNKKRGPHEHYACVGPQPFRVDLPAGKCMVQVFHGKEYAPVIQEVVVAADKTVEVEFKLHRHFNMAEKGWYSGDLHVHTPLSSLPVFQLAEDLNVAFPITAWAQDSKVVPRFKGGKVPDKGELYKSDNTHVYWTLNTEYEIFSLEGSRGKYGEYVQGAIMFLGHHKPITKLVPPVGPAADEARKQGAIIDWDKHCWAWSSMLVPVAGVETMELSCNHMWRLNPFYFNRWGEPAPDWMNRTFDNRGWAEYGFQVYYALLNCGFDIRPSAGTANGVHPVPLGFSRVYVKVDGPFTYEKWVEGLKKGRSFTTNGPMLILKTDDGLMPGDRKRIPADQPSTIRVSLEAQSINKLDRVELIVNGKVAQVFDCSTLSGDQKHGSFRKSIKISGTSWIAARCFEAASKESLRFAHTGAIFFEAPGKPLLPEPRQVEYFLDSLHRAMERYGHKLSPEALAEYEQALKAYRLAAKKGLSAK